MTKTRRRPDKPLTKQAAEFVIFHLSDKSAFHPFTGTDYDAWNAYVPLVRLWGRLRNDEVAYALQAVIASAQWRNRDVMAVFKKAIPCLLDWSDEPKLWRQIAPRATTHESLNEVAADGETICWPCGDGPRVCHHERSDVRSSGMEPDYRECRDCGALWRPAS